MPVPLAVMPPFMAYQSLVMGDAFGKGFQYGKRKISAMSNEQFNALSEGDLLKDSMSEYTRMIPTVKEALDSSTELQVYIVKEMMRVLPVLIKEFGESLVIGVGSRVEKEVAFIQNVVNPPLQGFIPPEEKPGGEEFRKEISDVRDKTMAEQIKREIDVMHRDMDVVTSKIAGLSASLKNPRVANSTSERNRVNSLINGLRNSWQRMSQKHLKLKLKYKNLTGKYIA